MSRDKGFLDSDEKDKIVKAHLRHGRIISKTAERTGHQFQTVRSVLEERDLIGFGKLHYYLSLDVMEDAGFNKDNPIFSYGGNGKKRNVYIAYCKEKDKTTVILEKGIQNKQRKSEIYLVVSDGDITDKIKDENDIDNLKFMHIGEKGSLDENVLVFLDF